MAELSWPLLALHLLGAVGFVIVVSLGKITEPIRNSIWPRMMGCPMCFGVWGGAAWVILLSLRPSLGLTIARLHDMAAFAFAVSLLGFIVAMREHEIGSLHAHDARQRRDGE